MGRQAGGKPSGHLQETAAGGGFGDGTALAIFEHAPIQADSPVQGADRDHAALAGGPQGGNGLLGEQERLRSCGVLIVVAGMEGALPSVIAGLVTRPVIAVPTSVGYGANLGGLSALLGMLTSCSNRVTVVNIDNGFGAACAADAILRLVTEASA